MDRWDSISKENRQQNKMIFGISSCILSLLFFSVLEYLAILKGLPPWSSTFLSAEAQPFSTP